MIWSNLSSSPVLLRPLPVRQSGNLVVIFYFAQLLEGRAVQSGKERLDDSTWLAMSVNRSRLCNRVHVF